MIKAYLLILAMALTPSIVMADFSKVGFRAYSSETPVTCSVMGGTWGKTLRGETVAAFNPIAATARSYSLNTKGFGNYSAKALGVKQMMVKCHQTAAPATEVVVKLYFDNVETYFFPMSNILLYVQY